MNRTTRTLVLALTAGALTQLAACATYPQQGYAQPQQPGTYPIYQAAPACANGMMSDPTVNSVVGGALGGFAGNQFGKGTGKSAMTALGAVAGVIAGQQVASASRANCY
ncbi:MAG: glycine zipper 2TM domain-containing protein [Nevskiaceae bacterium]|nr:MAG: glycine zipper 2TM domain-containing protein [Nevskiaceae bacterium]TBR71990.1 MAG: glycine zipper 2TM domain-containing protein [Nevskiaceae bacterium]